MEMHHFRLYQVVIRHLQFKQSISWSGHIQWVDNLKNTIHRIFDQKINILDGDTTLAILRCFYINIYSVLSYRACRMLCRNKQLHYQIYSFENLFSCWRCTIVILLSIHTSVAVSTTNLQVWSKTLENLYHKSRYLIILFLGIFISIFIYF